MYELLAKHFAGVDRATFDGDLAGKNWVLLLEAAGRLQGFTTLAAYDTVHEGRVISVVCSGDTIVEPDAWQSAALPRSWIAAVREIRWRELGGDHFYWLLLTSGIRTYRLLPVFWRDFHPRHDAAIPAATQALMTSLARERFGTGFRPDEGTVQFPAPQVLREHLRVITPGRLTDPHVAYFLRRNPGWPSGDELVCLTEIAFDNLTPAGRRMWGTAAPRLETIERAV
jgi:hypothetical protein